MDAIRITNLVKKYGQKLAVENLSLTVPTGIMFGFLGPNGSGKSTTIGCMTGLLDATSGQIELLGEPFTTENAAIKRRIGVMPETPRRFRECHGGSGIRRYASPTNGGGTWEVALPQRASGCAHERDTAPDGPGSGCQTHPGCCGRNLRADGKFRGRGGLDYTPR